MSSLVGISEAVSELVRRVEPSVVSVESRRGCSVSGVVWAKDLVVSAAHAIERDEKIQVVTSGGQRVDLSTVTLTPDEYSRYLKKAYDDADFKKPRNFIGLTKTLPDEDMKRSLAYHAPVDDTSLHALAEQRAQSVRQYLSQKIDASRIAIVAPHFGTEGMKDNGPSTRVDLTPTN